MAANTSMTVVLCYDVSSSAKRRRVAKLCQEKLVRVQKSVFEGRLTRAAADTLFEQVETALSSNQHKRSSSDNARMYIITATGLEKCRTSGGMPLTTDASHWLF